jgi:hypothetical protein
MRVLDESEDGGTDARWRLGLRLSAVMVLASSLYGAVLGSWHGARLALLVALKLPLVLLATSALTVLFAWMVARLCGVPLTPGRTAVLGFRALTVASLLMASLAPVAALFTYAAPPPSPSARTAHNLLYLMHTAVVGGCGLVGALALGRSLRRVAASAAAARTVHAAWVLAYALVGGEVAWALRPFVGSVYEPVAFLRHDALDGNVYEFIVTDIVPHLSGRPVRPGKESR